MNKETTHNLAYNELIAIEMAISVFRSCPAIPFSLANNINSNYSPIKAAITVHGDSVDLMRERAEILKPLEKTDNAAFENQVKDNHNELLQLWKTKYPLNLKIIDISEFADLAIDGEKEVRQQDGSIAKLSYRDAYFALLEFGIIK